MCTSRRNMPPKARRLLILAQLCLVLGLLPALLFESAAHPLPLWLHAVRGLFLGFSISLNLGALIVHRRHMHSGGI